MPTQYRVGKMQLRRRNMTAEEKLLELLEIQDKINQVNKEINKIYDNADWDPNPNLTYPVKKLDPFENKQVDKLSKEEVDLTRQRDNFIKTHNVDNDFALAKEEYKRLRAPLDELEIKAEKIRIDDHNLRSKKQDSAHSIQNLSSEYKSISQFFIAAIVLLAGACVHTFLVGSSSKVVLLLSALLAALFIPLSIVAAKQSSKLKRKSQRISNRPYSNDFFLKENYEKWKTISDEITAKKTFISGELAHLAWMLEKYEKVYYVKEENSILKLENRKKIPQYTPDSPPVKDLQKLHTGKTLSIICIFAVVIAAIMNLVPIGIASAYNSISMSFVWTSAAYISAAIAIALAFTARLTAKKEEKGTVFIGGLIGGFLLPLIPAAILVIIIAVVVQAFAGNPYVRISKNQIQELEITSIESEYSETLNLTEMGSLYWEFYGIIDHPYYFGGDNQKIEAKDIIETTFEHRDTYYGQPTCVTWNDGNNVTSAQTNSGALGSKITVKVNTDGVSEIKMLVGVYKGWNNYMTVYDENGNVVESALIIASDSEEKQSLLTFDLSDYDGEIFTVVFECYESTNNGISLTAVTVS